MTGFKAIQTINVLYVIGIISIAIFNNLIQVDPESGIWNAMRDGALVVLTVLLISIPNMLSVRAVPPGFKFTKTAIVLNVICILLFVVGLIRHEQERLAIQWGATVITICSINIVALVLALVSKRGSQSDENNIAYS